MRRRVTTALLCALVGLTGCAGNGPAPVPAEGWFNQLQTQVFDQHCLSAGCHNAQSVAGGLNLSPGASYSNLVNVEPDNPVARADGLVRAKAFEVDQSFLYTKVTAPGAGEGARMPQGMQPLSNDDINLIRDWIINGAPNASTPGPSVSPTVVESTPTPSVTPSITATSTATPLPPDTSTPTVTVTGTAPPTSTPSATESASPTPTATGTPAVSFELIQTTIFDTTCATQFCHDAGTKSGNLDLEAAVSYDQLVNVVPDNANARNAGLLRVDPSNSANSFLLIKVEGPTTVLQGSRMPLGMPKLSDAQIELINAWIAAGAKP